MNSIEDRNLFKSSIGIALDEWDSLQASIEHGMGGEFTNEKIEWMIDVIKQYFIDTKNSFDFEDAVNYVEEIMDKEFDTIIEDGSTELLIRKIMKFFSLNNEQKYDELRSILNEKSTKLNATKELRKQKRLENKLNEDLEEFDLDDNTSSEEDTNETNQKKDNRATVDDEGWTNF